MAIEMTTKTKTAIKTQKHNRLSIRTSEVEKELLEHAAKTKRMNMSQFVLQVSLEAAQNIVVDQTEFRLPKDQWDKFCLSLEEPAKVIPQLQHLFSESEPYGRS